MVANVPGVGHVRFFVTTVVRSKGKVFRMRSAETFDKIQIGKSVSERHGTIGVALTEKAQIVPFKRAQIDIIFFIPFGFMSAVIIPVDQIRTVDDVDFFRKHQSFILRNDRSQFPRKIESYSCKAFKEIING